MPVDGVSGATQTRAQGGTGISGPGSDTTQTFLTLLMTQLKTQDPLSPMDPKEMVSQLVQFNTLGQIMSIRELMEAQQSTNTDAQTPAQNDAGGN